MITNLTIKNINDLPLTEEELKEEIEAGRLKGWYLFELKNKNDPSKGRYYVGDIWDSVSSLQEIGLKFETVGATLKDVLDG